MQQNNDQIQSIIFIANCNCWVLGGKSISEHTDESIGALNFLSIN